MSAAIEFALVAPAVTVMVGASVAALGIGGESIRLADAAATAARAAGRGDDALAVVMRLTPAASMRLSGDEVVCVQLNEAASVGWLAGVVDLSASSCAPGGGK